MPEQVSETAPPKPFKWGFASSAGLILLLLVIGDVAGNLLSRWPPMRGLFRAIGAFSGHGRFEGGVLDSMVARDWLFGAFMIAAAAVAWFNRTAILRFFRAMQTGVMLIALTTLAILTGVLVPQIENFEDPEQRVTAANRADELNKFQWAEGYFFYHLTHLYGIGMPKAEVPPAALEGLERFGRIYGAEEKKNRAVMMNAAFTGQAKTGEIEDFVRAHKQTLDKAFGLCTTLDLNRTYKSAWFATLIWLLGIGVLCNTFKYPWRALLTFEKAGFLVTHAGILTLLTGGMISNLFTDRGILELRLGEPPEDTYYRHYQMNKRMRMPFSVKLDRFARKEWKALDVFFLQEKFESRPPRYTVWPGRRIPLDWKLDASGVQQPELELVVREVHDHAQANDPEVWEGEANDGGPKMAAAQFDAPFTDEHELHAHAEQPAASVRRSLMMVPEFSSKPWIDPAGKFRLQAAHGVDPKSAFPAEGDDTFATLDVDVMSTGQEAPVPMRIRIGDRLDVAGGYQLVVRSATRDFKPGRDTSERGPADPLPLFEQADGFRAVWIDVVPPGGKEPERRLLSEVLDPVEYGLQDGFKYKEVVVRLRWDRWTEAGAPRFVFGWDAAGKARLVAQDGTEKPVAIGQELDLPGETSVVLKALFERLRAKMSLEFTPGIVQADGFEPAFYERDARGIVLDVIHNPRTPAEKIETIRMATIPDSQADRWVSNDGRVGIQFVENDEGFPFDWRSVLSIVEKDASGKPRTMDCGTEKEREIRVNDYFTYKGYRFFQTNANPKDPTYSGIGVVYDPGIEIVLLGMYTIIAGTVLAFTVRPIVRSRRRAGVTA